MNNLEEKYKKIINLFSGIFIVVLFIVAISLVILKYNVEGEVNMPFNLSSIIVVSNAEGLQKEEKQATWDLNLVQNNDVYIEITKNKNYKETEIIDKIILDNFRIINNPQNGETKIYRPSENEKMIYENKNEYIVEDKLEYIGAENTNIKDLKIANQGGMIMLRFANINLGEYISNDDEIKHDGTILSKIDIKNEEIKFKMAFDITIKLKSEKEYKATIELDFPAGNVIEEGTSSYEKTSFKDVVFKR